MTLRPIAVILLFAAVAQAEWHNALKPSAGSGPELTLVENGEPKYTIAVPEEASPRVMKAADDLSHWVKEITGAQMHIASGKDRREPPLVVFISIDSAK